MLRGAGFLVGSGGAAAAATGVAILPGTTEGDEAEAEDEDSSEKDSSASLEPRRVTFRGRFSDGDGEASCRVAVSHCVAR